MKRILSFILTFILLFSLVSCSSVELEQTEEEKQTSSEKTQEAEQKNHDITGSFAVGYAKGEISPMRLAVPLAGYGNTSFRNSRSIKDKIYFTIVAVTDAEGETALVCTVDLISFRTDEFAGQCRKILSEATGVS